MCDHTGKDKVCNECIFLLEGGGGTDQREDKRCWDISHVY